jgi:magnesium transporter
MIEILLKNKEIIRVNSTDEIKAGQMDFYAIQFVDYTDAQISWAAQNFGIDCSLMHHYEDIEISSHFLVKNNQTAFHISIPYYCSKEEKRLVESPIFFVLCDKGLFFFSNSSIDRFFNKKYANKFSGIHEVPDIRNILLFHLEFISDYYADITESEARQIKQLAASVLLKNESSDEITDLITTYNFNNLLLKESLIETIRVFGLYKKNVQHQTDTTKDTIESELNDLSVISDYIQFNLERLNNLKENIKNKIDLEQNRIFKILTVITLCLSLPALISGIYGMNFADMPGVNRSYGYPFIMVLMLLSVVLPYLYFKRKKWM